MAFALANKVQADISLETDWRWKIEWEERGGRGRGCIPPWRLPPWRLPPGCIPPAGDGGVYLRFNWSVQWSEDKMHQLYFKPISPLPHHANRYQNFKLKFASLSPSSPHNQRILLHFVFNFEFQSSPWVQMLNRGHIFLHKKLPIFSFTFTTN